MNDRIKEIRKSFQLTLEEFGKRLGVTKTAISRVENGDRGITDQMILSICREYNINEEWLRTGRGNMKEDIPVEDEYFKAATQISKGKDKLAMQAIIEYWKLDEKSKQVFRDYLKNVVEKSRD